MNNFITKKLISGTITLFIIFSFIFSPSISYAIGTTQLNWENPNSSGAPNPFKFKLSDSLNSSNIMDVVGCTGIVNKVSTAVIGFVQKPINDALDRIKKRAEEKVKAAAVRAAGAAVGSTAIVPVVVGIALEDAIVDTADKIETAPVEDLEKKKRDEEEKKRQDAIQKREECLNGIAVKLAKNQLTAITRSTMNWVTTGFGGDPMYVQNMTSFMNGMTSKILEKEVSLFKDKNLYPYGSEYARNAIGGYKTSQDFAGSMKQTLSKYLSNGSKDYNESYFNNFGLGGWNGWLAFTQQPQNNPLGFQLKVTENTASKQTAQVEETKAELDRNGGFIDQKVCVEYENKETIIPADEDNSEHKTTEKVCVKWKTVTPGSVILNKISEAVNSPERQTELAKTMNDVLNSVFSALVGKLQQNGLTSLGSTVNSSSGYDTSEFANNGGFGSNKVFDTDGNLITTSSASGGYSGKFDITKDLGNTYTNPRYAGDWNASLNTTTNISETSLAKGLGIKNNFYYVSFPGDTSLFDGNTYWTKGEYAFFDGTKWRKGVPSYVIQKRGIIQLQQDYINNVQKILKILPDIMPAVGELDYCIPGPNPSWEYNSSDAYSAYTDWLYSIKQDLRGGSFLKRPYVKIGLPLLSSLEYKAYYKVFEGTDLWTKVLNSPFFNSNPRSDWSDPFNRLNVNCNGTNNIQKWKGAECMGKSLNVIQAGIEKWSNIFEKSNKEYIIEFNKRYGTRGFLNDPFNSKYIEMAQTGLTITKNIVEYDRGIKEATTNYQDAIIDGCSNIYKLNVIKEKVNTIVKAAQARRDKEGIKVTNTCKEAELGSYVVNDNDTKVLLKGCGNTIIEESIDLQEIKELNTERQRQKELEIQDIREYEQEIINDLNEPDYDIY